MLLDTDVLIDLERKNTITDAWFATLPTVPGVVGFAAMEVMNGCRDTREKRKVEKFLRPFPVVWPAEPTLARALREFTGFRLSHGLQRREFFGLFRARVGALTLQLRQGLYIRLAT
jgi:predicted nucleic acid-binding protein